MPQGFFAPSTLKVARNSPAERFGCSACGLYEFVLSPKINPYGRFRKRIMNVGEAPGKTEDSKGKPWQGKVGRLLKNTYTDLGIDLFDDCINLNSANCFPSSDTGAVRKPTSHEIACCREVKVLPAIDEHAPDVLILLGGSALESIYGRRWPESLGGISRWRGTVIPDYELNCWVCPVFHPSYIARSEDSVTRVVWERDLKNAFRMVGKPLPKNPFGNQQIELVESGDVGEALFEFCKGARRISFDYETTGLKPHAEGHRIICVGVAVDDGFQGKVMSALFPADPDSPKLDGWRAVLADKKIAKSAHNMKFEQTWSRKALGQTVVNWEWDTMLAAHVLDSRRQWTGLKFQIFTNFGMVDYVTDIENCLEAETANSHNGVEKFCSRRRGRKELLEYCGRDALFQLHLARRQRNQFRTLGKGMNQAYRLLHDGALAFQRSEEWGMVLDVDYCRDKEEELTDLIKRSRADFKRTEMYEKWQKRFLGKTNLNSSSQLGEVLYKEMKLKVESKTAAGKGATDEKALRALRLPELDNLLEARKYRKLRDTYLKNWAREQVNGRIHPFFNLHSVSSYRSSSDRPNFQNVPKRSKEAYETCRRAIRAREGRRFLEVDYSGIEVRIAACVTQDEKLIHDVLHGDMHRDMAIELYLLDGLDKSHKGEARLRQGAKNGFVFPQFYGDYYKNNVPILLEWARDSELADGTPVYEHLQNCDLVKLNAAGEVKDASGLLDHTKRVEERFWKDRYKKYDAWKKRFWKRYNMDGFVEFVTGFRVGGELKRNEVLNVPIQGAAFHCLLWSYIQLDVLRRRRKWKSRIVGQIHDAVLFEVAEGELKTVARAAKDVMEKRLVDEWDWLIVPLDVEMELFEIGGPWLNGEDYRITEDEENESA